MSWKRTYGSDPMLSEFVPLEAGGARVLVRRGYEAEVERLGLAGGAAAAERWVGGGREPHPLVALASGERAVVRRYLRGGALRHLNRAHYFVGHRSFAELRATERAAAVGVRVPRVVAAAERRAGLGYTASLATLWIPDAAELADWLHGRSEAEREAALRAAGREVARMHAGGIGHPDLNLRNLLVAPSDEGPVLYLLDFDRARLYPGAAPQTRRARDLLRLARSARKLGAPIHPAGWEALRTGYGAEWPLRSPLG